MLDYGSAMHLLIDGGAVGALANGALAWSNTIGQRRIVRQQRAIGERQQELETDRLALDERAQIWSEMRDLIAAQARQLQASRWETAQLTGKYEELLRRHEILEAECRKRHTESLLRIQALEAERARLAAALSST